MSMAPIPPKRWASEQPTPDAITNPGTPSPAQPISTADTIPPAPPPTAPPAPDPNRPIPSLQTVLADIPRQDQIAAHDRLTKQIALTVVIGFFLVIGSIFVVGLSGRSIDTTMVALLSSLVGVAAAGFGVVMNYYFGSSSGSAQKTTTINTALTQAMTEKGAA
jgi:hypothetical protein